MLSQFSQPKLMVGSSAVGLQRTPEAPHMLPRNSVLCSGIPCKKSTTRKVVNAKHPGISICSNVEKTEKTLWQHTWQTGKLRKKNIQKLEASDWETHWKSAWSDSEVHTRGFHWDQNSQPQRWCHSLRFPWPWGYLPEAGWFIGKSIYGWWLGVPAF